MQILSQSNQVSNQSSDALSHSGGLNRIAWLGPSGDSGGVPSLGTNLLAGLLRKGVQVDYYTSTEKEISDRLREFPNLNIIAVSPQWEWGKWYSRNAFSSFLSSNVARMRAYNRLSDLVISNHLQKKYDCIFQLSQTELFKLGKNLHQLPPVIVYPCVHAAGELYWHGQESAYALEVESSWMHYITRMILSYRAWVQKREVRKPNLIIGMSQRFNSLTQADYGIQPSRQAILYNPIPAQSAESVSIADELAIQRTVIKLLFVARISVRKGVQHLIDLSHRLDDLSGQIEIDVIGDRSQWSNYLPHLDKLNPNIARYLGGMQQAQLNLAYQNADAILLPSLYEPGGIVIGEALSHGLCIVVSDAIGSAEVIEGDCHRHFPAGDMDRFEQEVRKLVNDLKTNRQPLREAARQQCTKHFAPDKIAQDGLALIQSVVAKSSV
jgi:glycosyltransferase involved in cell wall biosynthesis